MSKLDEPPVVALLAMAGWGTRNYYQAAPPARTVRSGLNAGAQNFGSAGRLGVRV
jgi:hypothetical protein